MSAKRDNVSRIKRSSSIELPNYMNQGVAGPLLDKDPFMSGACNHDCGENNSYDPTRLDRVQNKGQVLTTAMALFGRGSFPETRLANPRAYVVMPDPYPAGTPQMVYDTNRVCGYLLPLAALLLGTGVNGYPDPGNELKRSCIFNSEGDGGAGVRYEVGRWLVLFTNYTAPERLSNAFTAAAFLANQNWLLSQATTFGGEHLSLFYDEGMEIQAPVISTAGIIIVSVLLGLYLAALLALAVYAAWTPRWTRTLNSFDMMRVDAAYRWHFPLDAGLFLLTPLLRAVWKGNEAIVRLLLKKGARPDSEDSLDRSPLSVAKEKGNKTIISLLKLHGKSS
ncbi:hypothetical protein B0O99DRAFT_747884 [Bisporella sp. PMI_857]|nr:hypothetical protein B0O99DRAFT_747884 [Bisporella sp. PMI_857]